MSTLGERIRIARSGISQDIFSAKISVSKGSLGGYERDENLPNTDVILKICSETNISVEWLMTGHGSMRPGETAQAIERAAEQPVNTPETVSCARCAEMKAELEEERKERRELSAERRKLSELNIKLFNENGELKAKCATLEERQKTCCPDPQVFEKLPNIPPSKTDLRT